MGLLAAPQLQFEEAGLHCKDPSRLAVCGFASERATRKSSLCRLPAGWDHLRAAQRRRVAASLHWP